MKDPRRKGRGESSTQTHEIETQITGPGRAGSSAGARLVPGLTVLAHPDVSRVGDRIALPVLAAGREIRLSRLEPLFSAPGGGEPRALKDPHLSRSSLRLSGTAEKGSVALERGAVRTAVAADGVPVDGRRSFPAAEVERGVVLELGHRVVLLLHPMPALAPASARSSALVGESPAMVRLRGEVERVAALDVPVLLRGETGTGKELVANELHRRGRRRGGPLVAVNMATLAPSLAAAELFGAVKGAFTGAERTKPGLFEKARGGILFLDEIGETPLEVQAMLLRALETSRVLPVGGVEEREVDVRVVAATDADLEVAIAEGRFRAPLYHRLAGWAIELPPLRQRRDDVGRLLFHFLAREEPHAETRSEDSRPWPPAELVARLARAPWPGNVRQLRNVARRLAIAGPGDTEVETWLREELGEDTPMGQDPPAEPTSQRSEAVVLHRPPKEVSEDELLEALRANGWRIKPTAAHLRVSRTSLYALIDRCSKIRRAADLGREELASSFERHGGDLGAMAGELEVSPQGLRHRLQELGIGKAG